MPPLSAVIIQGPKIPTQLFYFSCKPDYISPTFFKSFIISWPFFRRLKIALLALWSTLVISKDSSHFLHWNTRPTRISSGLNLCSTSYWTVCDVFHRVRSTLSVSEVEIISLCDDSMTTASKKYQEPVMVNRQSYQ